ncbi:MAG TPA: right-handed parallel beta-helix repeat-containing protein [Opitutaceae bacterium]
MNTPKFRVSVLSLLSSGLWLLVSSSFAATATYPIPGDANSDGIITSSDIQAAIDASKGVVFLPAAKTYQIDASILIDQRHGVSLLGEGDTTVLTITGNVEALVATNSTGCGVRGVKFVGPAGHTKNTVRFQGCTDAFVNRVTFQQTYRAVEAVECISPTFSLLTMTNLTGDYGIRLGSSVPKVDAAILHDITGSTTATNLDWLLIGPNVDGAEIQTASFTGGKRGLRTLGSPGPKYVDLNEVTITGCAQEGVRIEAGNDLLVNATTISQTAGSGFTITSGFTGGAVLTDLTISSAGRHGLQIDGGRDIGILNPQIGGNGTALTSGAAGIYLGAAVSYVSVTDGCVGSTCGLGSSTGQTYGIRFAGTSAQSDSQDVKIKTVNTTGNPTPYTPTNLPGN